MGTNLSPADFAFIAEYVLKSSAILLPAGKEYLVKSRLSHIVEQDFNGSFTNLVNHLKKSGGNTSSNTALQCQIVDAMTTNETSFFRDKQPFEVFENTILPKLIEQNKLTKRLNIWSAAASSGQEIYSLLMLIEEKFPLLRNWNINVYASDISETMLKRVQLGQYSDIEIGRGLPESLKLKYFTPAGHLWQISDNLRQKVKTQKINLVTRWPLMPKMDLILLRNVLIYFSAENKEDICQRMMGQINPGGCFILGSSESSTNLRSNYTMNREKNTLWYTHKQADKAAA